ADGRRNERSDQSPARESASILRVGDPDRKPRLLGSQVMERPRPERARNRTFHQTVPAELRRELASMPAALDVCVQADRGRGEKLERLLQGRQLGRDFSQLRKPQWTNAAGSHAVADF